MSTGKGYWLLGLDGGIFTFGGAKFHGSTGAMHLNQPINGMERTSNNNGYWLVAYDGGIFTFGDARFFGSMPGIGGLSPGDTAVAINRTAGGPGYVIFTRRGGAYPFGDATTAADRP